MAGELNLLGRPAAGLEALKRRSAGRSRSHVRRTRNRPRPKEAAAFKKSARMPLPRRRQSPRASRSSLRHGQRASHWPKADHPPRVGATGQASDRAWPSPVRLAHMSRHFVSPATGETFLVCFQRRVEGILRGFCAKPLRARPKRA